MKSTEASTKESQKKAAMSNRKPIGTRGTGGTKVSEIQNNKKMAPDASKGKANTNAARYRQHIKEVKNV